MRAYKITGGTSIVGTIDVLGAKNFVTKAMVAALLSDQKSTLTNVPDIGDVSITKDMITSTGVEISVNILKNELIIDPSTLRTPVVTLPESGSNRIPILMIGALLRKFGRAEVPALAGCSIGARPVDFHVMALEKFGAVVEQTDTNFVARIDESLKGAKINLPYPSVGATETCLFLGCISQGKTVIENAATEPEIMELITMLRSMGAIIFTQPNRKIIIEGGRDLFGTTIYSIGDRIDAASWACLAAASDGEITVNGIRPKTLATSYHIINRLEGELSLLMKKRLDFLGEPIYSLQ